MTSMANARTMIAIVSHTDSQFDQKYTVQMPLLCGRIKSASPLLKSKSICGPRHRRPGSELVVKHASRARYSKSLGVLKTFSTFH